MENDNLSDPEAGDLSETTENDNLSDLETDDISLQYNVNINVLLHNPSSSFKKRVISYKRKCDSDNSSSSDSDETESISAQIDDHLKHLSVDETSDLPVQKDHDSDMANKNAVASFSDEKHFDEDGDTPLHILIIFRDIFKLLLFLDSCSGTILREIIDKRNKLGQTALHIAAILKDVEIIECLLYAGADPGVQDACGNTILHIFANNKSIEMLKALCKIFELKYAYVDYSDTRCKLTEILNYDGLSAFHIAVVNNDKKMAVFLLSIGASPWAAERKSGRTALHLAAEIGNLEIIRVITESKESDIDKKTYNGQTALVVAYHRGNSHIVDFLKDRGAEYDPAVIKQYGPVKRKSQRKGRVE